MAEKVKASRSSNRRRTFLDNLPFRKLFRRNNTMPEMTTNPDNSKKNEEDNSSGPASSAKEGGKERERPGTPKPSSVTTAGDSGQTSPKPPQPQTAFDSAAALLAQYGYGLGEQLGKGSYAIVRSASSKKHKRRVAIKIISKKKAPEDYLTKFLPREIQVLKRLRHSNCISLLEAIETNTRIYLIMNLAENGDLLEYIRERGPMPDDDARRYFRQLITATDYFHSLGIVHRDLKCENLLLDINHNIVVSDFGFARGQMINPETGKRRLSQTFCGSYAYAPPEILRGKVLISNLEGIMSLHRAEKLHNYWYRWTELERKRRRWSIFEIFMLFIKNQRSHLTEKTNCFEKWYGFLYYDLPFIKTTTNHNMENSTIFQNSFFICQIYYSHLTDKNNYASVNIVILALAEVNLTLKNNFLFPLQALFNDTSYFLKE